MLDGLTPGDLYNMRDILDMQRVKLTESRLEIAHRLGREVVNGRELPTEFTSEEIDALMHFATYGVVYRMIERESELLEEKNDD